MVLFDFSMIVWYVCLFVVIMCVVSWCGVGLFLFVFWVINFIVGNDNGGCVVVCMVMLCLVIWFFRLVDKLLCSVFIVCWC